MRIVPIISGIEVVDENGDEWQFSVQICAASNCPVTKDDLRRMQEAPDEWLILPSGNRIKGHKVTPSQTP